jgi:hypothetical protein
VSKLKAFQDQLDPLRKPKSKDRYDDRTNHCYLYHTHNDKEHCFEVRGWNQIRDGKLCISVVNWTIMAGPGSLFLTEEIVDRFRIEKERLCT